MSVAVGATRAAARTTEPKAAAPRGGRPTRAELLQRAAELGVRVPSKATKAQISRLVEGA